MRIYCNVCHEPFDATETEGFVYLDPCPGCRHQENVLGYHRGYNDGLAHRKHEAENKKG